MNNSINYPSAKPTINQRGRIQWPGEPAIKQAFPVPDTLIYYISMNPSTPKAYNKLIQTCKFFFERNPILVAAILTEKSVCSNDKCNRYGNGECCVKIDIKKITSKIWITRCLNLFENIIPNFPALLRPKTYRCNSVKLMIYGGTINFDDFKVFALFAENINLNEVQIISNNDVPVMLENVLEVIPNLEKFSCYFKDNASMVSVSTVKNISKLKNLDNFKHLGLLNLPEAFQIDDLFTLINDRSDIEFRLDFAANISEQYKTELDHLTDSLIESKLSNCYITYFGQSREKNYILWKLSRT